MLSILKKLINPKQVINPVVPIFQETYEKFVDFTPSSTDQTKGLTELIKTAEKDPLLKTIASLSFQRVVLKILNFGKNLNIDSNGKFYVYHFDDMISYPVHAENRDVIGQLGHETNIFERVKIGITEYIRDAPYEPNRY